MIDLNEHTIAILGTPNFVAGSIAILLRKGGHAIERKSEHEQAYVIWWLLSFYAAHGARWRDAAYAELEKIPLLAPVQTVQSGRT